MGGLDQWEGDHTDHAPSPSPYLVPIVTQAGEDGLLEDLLYPSNHPEVEVEVEAANPLMEAHNHLSSHDLYHTLLLLPPLLHSSNLEVEVDQERTSLHVHDHQHKHPQQEEEVVVVAVAAEDQGTSVDPSLFPFPSPYLALVPFHAHAPARVHDP